MQYPVTYRVIGFGEAEYGFFNAFRFGSSRASAEESYQEFYAMPEFEGVVMIEVRHETWSVVKECGTQEVSIVYGPLGNFKVERAPKLVLV